MSGQAVTAGPGPPVRLLVADGDPSLRRVLHLALQARGYQVTLADTANAALRLRRPAVLGHSMGAATALMSEEAALACTDAVETEIDKHYSRPLAELGEAAPDLAADIARDYANRARTALQSFKDSPAKDALEQALDFVLDRDR